uniref:Rad60/SUMO-like domain-containing protein n=1 Tax=Timspurckia oligopyrenoides TaxID=708627 RepID=A0A7S0ZKA4_9RHOD|mmetsp:Transcript_8515/g.15416  ORF Transcript_8515/g.15416 Transcript_8515/m.15416 type:complete len:317 (+) Transcript_8515:54-1004(+)
MDGTRQDASDSLRGNENETQKRANNSDELELDLDVDDENDSEHSDIFVYHSTRPVISQFHYLSESPENTRQHTNAAVPKNQSSIKNVTFIDLENRPNEQDEEEDDDDALFAPVHSRRKRNRILTQNSSNQNKNQNMETVQIHRESDHEVIVVIDDDRNDSTVNLDEQLNHRNLDESESKYNAMMHQAYDAIQQARGQRQLLNQSLFDDDEFVNINSKSSLVQEINDEQGNEVEEIKENDEEKKIGLKVRFEDGSELKFKMDRNERFGKMFGAIGIKKNVDQSKVQLIMDGEILDVNSTPHEMDLESNDLIDARIVQ